MSPLQIFEKHPDADDVYYIGGAWAPACITAKEKHFTEAELAAEMWMHYWGLIAFIKNGKANTRGKTDRQQALNRFASRPHAHESDYQ